MTFKSTQLDIYFHMANHYKKLKTVKSVVDTSAPSGYQELTHRKSRPSSRSDNCKTAKSNASNLDVMSVDKYKTSKPRGSNKENVNSNQPSRSLSVPPRPPTRRRPSNAPNLPKKFVFQPRSSRIADREKTNPLKLFSSNQSFGCESTTDSVFTLHSINTQINPDVGVNNCDSEVRLSDRSIPFPVPRQRRSKSSSYKNSITEHDYLQFLLRITEDIIRNDMYTHQDILRVFNSHIEANRGRLDESKMMQQIQILSKELSSEQSSRENCDGGMGSKKICACGSPETKTSPDKQSCECNSIRCSPLHCNLYKCKNVYKEDDGTAYENPIQVCYDESQQHDSQCAKSTNFDDDDCKVIHENDRVSNLSVYFDPKLYDYKLEESTQTEKPIVPDVVKSTSTSELSAAWESEKAANNLLEKEEAIFSADFLEDLNSITFPGSGVENECKVATSAIKIDKLLLSEEISNTSNNDEEYVLISGPIYVPKHFLVNNPNWLNLKPNVNLVPPHELDHQKVELTNESLETCIGNIDLPLILRQYHESSDLSGMVGVSSIITTTPTRSIKSSESSKSDIKVKKVKTVRKRQPDLSPDSSGSSGSAIPKRVITSYNLQLDFKIPDSSGASSEPQSKVSEIASDERQTSPLTDDERSQQIERAGLHSNKSEGRFFKEILAGILEVDNGKACANNSLALDKLNEYDLTPQRDSNCGRKSKIRKRKPSLNNDRLLLGDEYEIKSAVCNPNYYDNPILTDAIKQFYPDSETQTESKDWLLEPTEIKVSISPEDEPVNKYEHKDKQEQIEILLHQVKEALNERFQEKEEDTVAVTGKALEEKVLSTQRKSSLSAKYFLNNEDEKLVRKVQVDSNPVINDNKPLVAKITVDNIFNADSDDPELSSLEATIQQNRSQREELKKSIIQHVDDDSNSELNLLMSSKDAKNRRKPPKKVIGRNVDYDYIVPYIEVQSPPGTEIKSSDPESSTHILCCGLKSDKKKKRRDLPVKKSVCQNAQSIPDHQSYESDSEAKSDLSTPLDLQTARKSLRFDYDTVDELLKDDRKSSVATTNSKVGNRKPSLIELLSPSTKNSSGSIFLLDPDSEDREEDNIFY